MQVPQRGTWRPVERRFWQPDIEAKLVNPFASGVRRAPGTAGMTDIPALPRLLDINEVADHLGVSVWHVRRLVFERRIPFLKWGHLLRFDPADLAPWLDARRVASGETDACAVGHRDGWVAAPRPPTKRQRTPEPSSTEPLARWRSALQDGEMRPCVFCGSTEGRPSREHAVPKWARRAFPSEGPLRVHMGEGTDEPEFVHTRQHLNVTVDGIVCERCNNGFLSRLEKAVQPVLEPMLVEHRDTVLDVAAQKLLATWAVKTVFLIEQSFLQHYRSRPTPGHEPSDAEFAWITRREEPPPRSQVWLSSVDAAGAVALRYEPSGVPIPTRSGEFVHAHLTSLSVGYVALQVFTIDFVRAEALRAVPSWPAVPDRLRDTLLPIWPATKVRRWPPPAFLSDQWQNFVTWDGALRIPSR